MRERIFEGCCLNPVSQSEQTQTSLEIPKKNIQLGFGCQPIRIESLLQCDTREMAVNYLIPIYPPDDIIAMDWDDDLEMSLLVALGLLIVMQLLLLSYMAIAHFQPCTMYRQQLNECYRRRYGNYIFRRLLAQLDEALTQRPMAGQELVCCLQAKRSALTAIRLFCRDSAKVLYPTYELDTLAASDLYFVLDDEEAELNSAGYARTNFDITDVFLERLLYPKHAEPHKKNKILS